MPGSLPAPAPPPADAPPLGTEAPWRQRWLPTNELVLLAVLAAECAIFGLTGQNFLSRANAFEITRLSVEVGLIALALTAVIITGGIDLSVGSTMGLCAVVLGALWYQHHWPIAAAVPERVATANLSMAFAPIPQSSATSRSWFLVSGMSPPSSTSPVLCSTSRTS